MFQNNTKDDMSTENWNAGPLLRQSNVKIL